MKGLPTLVRLRRQQLDEKRRALVELEQREALLQRDITVLDQEVVREQEFSNSAEEVRFAYENFSVAARERRKTMVAEVAALQDDLEHARERVSDAFREYKKLDLAEANVRRRQAEERERLERIETDEIGAEMYRRKKA